MKTSDIRGEAALDVLADIMEPASKILGDNDFKETVKSGTSNPQIVWVFQIVRVLLKSHKHEVLEILAYLDGEDPATYSPSIFEIPKKLMELMQDEDLMSLFISESQKEEETSSGSATETTEDLGS